MAAPDARTRVVGIIGDPIAHSLSPRMHNAAFTATGLNWQYLAFRVPAAGLGDALRGLAALGVAGVNVTIPHKERVVPLLEHLDASAAEIGAVNTVRVRDNRLEGFNTDAGGLLDALTKDGGCDVRGARCVVLGAGGAARAAAFALARAGASRLIILNRTRFRADELARRVARAVPGCGADPGPLEPGPVGDAVREADILVHATSATMSAAMGGTGGRAEWLEAIRDALRAGMTVLDAVYTPVWTELLTVAQGAGATAVSGISMLVYQGARAFELWTGQPAPVDIMRRAADAEIPHGG